MVLLHRDRLPVAVVYRSQRIRAVLYDITCNRTRPSRRQIIRQFLVIQICRFGTCDFDFRQALRIIREIEVYSVMGNSYGISLFIHIIVCIYFSAYRRAHFRYVLRRIVCIVRLLRLRRRAVQQQTRAILIGKFTCYIRSPFVVHLRNIISARIQLALLHDSFRFIVICISFRHCAVSVAQILGDNPSVILLPYYIVICVVSVLRHVFFRFVIAVRQRTADNVAVCVVFHFLVNILSHCNSNVNINIL